MNLWLLAITIVVTPYWISFRFGVSRRRKIQILSTYIKKGSAILKGLTDDGYRYKNLHVTLKPPNHRWNMIEPLDFPTLPPRHHLLSAPTSKIKSRPSLPFQKHTRWSHLLFQISAPCLRLHRSHHLGLLEYSKSKVLRADFLVLHVPVSYFTITISQS